ncbi:MAG TPA: sensor histidine kinase [Terriglobales bacterium]|jgi:signal transduction histidine kinase|nr:sensor histidine kinase [Terriglobales bacterium]
MCRIFIGDVEHPVRRPMPGVSNHGFRSLIREPSADALKALGPRSAEIFARWQRESSGLGIEFQDFLGQAHLDFDRLSTKLRKMSFPAFQREVRELGGTLAQCRVPLDRSIDVINRLFEICVPHLMNHDPEAAAHILALSRLQSLLIRLVVSSQCESDASAPPKPAAKISPVMGDRRHDASVYVTKVYEEERKRLSRDLHDEVGHDLVLMKLYLEMIALDTNRKEFQSIRPRLNEAIGLVSHAIDSVRRLVLDLGPAVFDELGFLPAVRTYTSQFSARTKIAVTLREGYLPENIPMSHQVALYRLLQGALSNVLKHASAKTVKVSLGCMKDSVLILIIQDDGLGFDTTRKPGSSSFGLTAMRERVEVLGGRIHIQSMPAGSMSKIRGTRIEVDLPLSGGMQ